MQTQVQINPDCNNNPLLIKAAKLFAQDIDRTVLISESNIPLVEINGLVHIGIITRNSNEINLTDRGKKRLYL
jgi:predicted methyltransferase